MVTTASNGLVDYLSRYSVDETVDRLKRILHSKGITLFGLIDHSGEAEKVGINMPPTKLILFGNPAAGTPLMLAVPRCAIDLPLKLLVWEDGERKVRVSYNSTVDLEQRHNLPEELLWEIGIVDSLAAEASGNSPGRP